MKNTLYNSWRDFLAPQLPSRHTGILPRIYSALVILRKELKQEDNPLFTDEKLRNASEYGHHFLKFPQIICAMAKTDDHKPQFYLRALTLMENALDIDYVYKFHYSIIDKETKKIHYNYFIQFVNKFLKNPDNKGQVISLTYIKIKALQSLASTSLTERQYEKAVEYYQQALELISAHSKTLSSSIIRQGIPIYLKLISINPRQKAAQYLLKLIDLLPLGTRFSVIQKYIKHIDIELIKETQKLTQSSENLLNFCYLKEIEALLFAGTQKEKNKLYLEILKNFDSGIVSKEHLNTKTYESFLALKQRIHVIYSEALYAMKQDNTADFHHKEASNMPRHPGLFNNIITLRQLYNSVKQKKYSTALEHSKEKGIQLCDERKKNPLFLPYKIHYTLSLQLILLAQTQLPAKTNSDARTLLFKIYIEAVRTNSIGLNSQQLTHFLRLDLELDGRTPWHQNIFPKASLKQFMGEKNIHDSVKIEIAKKYIRKKPMFNQKQHYPYADIICQLADLCIRNQKKVEAEQCLTHGINFFKTTTFPPEILRRLLEKRANFYKTNRMIKEEAKDRKTLQALQHYEQGNALSKQDKVGEELLEYNKASQLADFPMLYLRQGYCYYQLDMYHKAIEYYDHFFKTIAKLPYGDAPTHIDAYGVRAESYAEIYSWEKAKGDCDKAITILSKYYYHTLMDRASYRRNFAVRAIANLELGDKEGAKADCKEAIQGIEKLSYIIGSIHQLICKGSYQKALKYIQLLLEFPAYQNHIILFAIPNAIFRTGDMKLTQLYAKEIMYLSPNVKYITSELFCNYIFKSYIAERNSNPDMSQEILSYFFGSDFTKAQYNNIFWYATLAMGPKAHIFLNHCNKNFTTDYLTNPQTQETLREREVLKKELEVFAQSQTLSFKNNPLVTLYKNRIEKGTDAEKHISHFKMALICYGYSETALCRFHYEAAKALELNNWGDNEVSYFNFLEFFNFKSPTHQSSQSQNLSTLFSTPISIPNSTPNNSNATTEKSKTL